MGYLSMFIKKEKLKKKKNTEKKPHQHPTVLKVAVMWQDI